MLQGIFGADPFRGIQCQQQRDEICHVLIKAVEDVIQAGGLWHEHGRAAAGVVIPFKDTSVSQEIAFGKASAAAHPGGHAPEHALHAGEHLGA